MVLGILPVVLDVVAAPARLVPDRIDDRGGIEQGAGIKHVGKGALARERHGVDLAQAVVHRAGRDGFVIAWDIRNARCTRRIDERGLHGLGRHVHMRDLDVPEWNEPWRRRG